MVDGLIGCTGFVGTNLLAAHHFCGKYNSKNIARIAGKKFDMLVCAAAPAAMWAANKDPESDLKNISQLISCLANVQAKHFVLISTVAVLADSTGFDESADCFESGKAYGKNRRWLEEACASLFPRSYIIRLPALFGVGLKKNFLFDIRNLAPSFLDPERYSNLTMQLPKPAATILASVYSFDANIGMYHCRRDKLVGEDRGLLIDELKNVGFTSLNFTNADSTFQFYGLSRLWSDIEIIRSHGIPIVHLVPEPLRAGDVYEILTGEQFGQTSAAVYHEDVRSKYAGIWRGERGYIQDRKSVVRELTAFDRERTLS